MAAADAKEADSTPPVIGPIPDPVRSASPTAAPKVRRVARNPRRPRREPTPRPNRPARDERTSSSFGGTVVEAMLLRGRQQLLLDLATQLVFGQDSRHPVHYLALCRQEHGGRHALDGEALHRGGINRIGKRIVNPQLRVELHRVLVRSQSGEGAYVYPDDDDLPGKPRGNLFKPRHFHLAGRAIPRPEVQDHRLSLFEALSNVVSLPPRISPWYATIRKSPPEPPPWVLCRGAGCIPWTARMVRPITAPTPAASARPQRRRPSDLVEAALPRFAGVFLLIASPDPPAAPLTWRYLPGRGFGRR